MSDEELRKLFEPAKRRAVALFKNDHDDGDTAVYQFISEVIPLLLDHDQQIAFEAQIKELERAKLQGYISGPLKYKVDRRIAVLKAKREEGL